MPNERANQNHQKELSPPTPNWFLSSRFWLFHAVFLGAAIWVAPTTETIVWGLVLYIIRMFGVTAGYHRYFSHKSFKTSRFFAFFLAFLAQSSAQRGVLWWASNHRHHHRYSDKEQDLHSPVQNGFFYSHVGWLFQSKSYEKHNNISDLEKFPELQFLNNQPMLPAIVLGVLVWLFLGWSGLVYSFGWSTLALFHGTFTINSLSHVWGSRRYNTKDDSRNNAFLALITLGEGWHNNHHHYMNSARQGFFWWELDLTYYALKLLSWCSIVWDLRPVPERIRMKHLVQPKSKVQSSQRSKRSAI